ncbi:MAG: HAMP domain-containing histidine kinase [Synergistaceae bacterium]|nr:HAMP domain-containing histidine kinase [Synergistaceae bacterium]
MKKTQISRLYSPTIKALRRKLAWGATVAISIILVFSVIASIFVLRYFITVSLKSTLFPILDDEINKSIPTFKAWKTGQKMSPSLNSRDDLTPVPPNINERAFSIAEFWFAADGTVLMARSYLESREVLIANFRHWPHLNREIYVIQVSPDDVSKTWHYIVMADAVYQDGELLGKVVVGANLTPLLRLTNHYYAIASVASLVVSVLIFFVCNYFVSKAILPIESAMAKQRHFVADASHELRTPLSILLSSVDMLNDKNENQALIQSMKEEILNMRSLTNSLLTLARFDGEDFNPAFFDLSDTLRAAVNAMQVVADAKAIKIVLSVKEGIQTYGDRMKIGQLVSILIDNAIKYSLENSTVRIEVTTSRAIVKIIVTDHGKGIPQEHLEHIFDRFYRVDKARSRQIGSYGLGLSIARSIVTLHKGEIQAESVEGKSSVFTVSLPYAM